MGFAAKYVIDIMILVSPATAGSPCEHCTALAAQLRGLIFRVCLVHGLRAVRKVRLTAFPTGHRL